MTELMIQIFIRSIKLICPTQHILASNIMTCCSRVHVNPYWLYKFINLRVQAIVSLCLYYTTEIVLQVIPPGLVNAAAE